MPQIRRNIHVKISKLVDVRLDLFKSFAERMKGWEHADTCSQRLFPDLPYMLNRMLFRCIGCKLFADNTPIIWFMKHVHIVKKCLYITFSMIRRIIPQNEQLFPGMFFAEFIQKGDGCIAICRFMLSKHE